MSRVYEYPAYYALAYRWQTREECNVVEHCIARWRAQRGTARLLDIGCGAGRHALELGTRGYHVVGVDPSPAMAHYTHQEAQHRAVPVTAQHGSLDALHVTGSFDVAICCMDTFRFLLTDVAIRMHLRSLASVMSDGGLYLIDHWISHSTDAPNASYVWEQADPDVSVQVDYRQYPHSWLPAQQTFEDELIFRVTERGQTQQIHGGRTRTRWLTADALRRCATDTGCWTVCGQFSGFDLHQPFPAHQTSWRLLTVLQRKKVSDTF